MAKKVTKEPVAVVPSKRADRFRTGLSAAEEERLSLLMEECAEVIHICAKIKRHGFASAHPAERDSLISNRQNLQKEIGHVLAAMDLMIANEDISSRYIVEGRVYKRGSVRQWLHFKHRFPNLADSYIQTVQK
jgi:NTP pyrophosphatase (non-canonical NTP hydrolase)